MRCSCGPAHLCSSFFLFLTSLFTHAWLMVEKQDTRRVAGEKGSGLARQWSSSMAAPDASTRDSTPVHATELLRKERAAALQGEGRAAPAVRHSSAEDAKQLSGAEKARPQPSASTWGGSNGVRAG